MRAILGVGVLLLILVLTTLPSQPAVAAPVNQTAQPFIYYPETGHNIGLAIKSFYDNHGGLAVFGLPLTELYTGENGVAVQYFERARFEYRPDQTPAVQISRAGALLSADRVNEPPFQWQVADSIAPGRTFFPEAGHSIGGAFEWFWQTNGGLTVFGYPISEEFEEINPLDGRSYLVQYFERARFEYHPEHAGTAFEVQLAHLGRQLIEQDPAAQARTAPVSPIALLGESSTSFATSSSERVINIARATAMADGWVIPAGGEFSFLRIGDFSEANGFVDGYAIVGGRLERVIGGGLCQVSTTLFRAVSNAGLDISRRVGHSHIVSFYENTLGFDATVFSPTVDFRWRNNSAGPVYVVGTTDSTQGRVTFQIFGIDDGREVSYIGPTMRNWRNPGRAVWQHDPSLPNGAVRQLVQGRRGVDVSYTRVISNAQGREISRNTYNTNYRPWEDFFVYGPGVTPPAGVEIIAPRRTR